MGRDMGCNVEAMRVQRRQELENVAVKKMAAIRNANHDNFKMFMNPEELEKAVEDRQKDAYKRELQDCYCVQCGEFMQAYRNRMMDLLEDVASISKGFEKIQSAWEVLQLNQRENRDP